MQCSQVLKMSNPKMKVADLYEVLCDFKKEILAEITEIKSQVCGFVEAVAKIDGLEKRVVSINNGQHAASDR